MTIKEFDQVVTSCADYSIFNSDREIQDFFTIDVSMDPDKYRRNQILRDKYQDAEIFHVYTLNDVIHVVAQMK